MRFLVFALGLLISTESYAKCSFRTADYSASLFSPEFIKSIDIKIPKSAKFARMQFKILTFKSEIIPEKLKKYFKANVVVNYDFGSCEYSGKVRQSGDFRDHIVFKKGNLLQSLDLKLEDGHVVGATRFKLLIPITRHGRNEILGTLLLRELNFIAPETFEVNVSVNGRQSLMLFQEKAEKELLEKNRRRDGPIFEGDESLLYHEDYDINELEPLSLSRLVNDNWFRMGNTSQRIVIKSFNHLQKAYFDHAYSRHLKKNDYFLPLNKSDDHFFNDYHLLVLAMGGEHALWPHNRQFYFNAIEDRFEPIYYDGNLSFSDFVFRENAGHGFFLRTPGSAELVSRVKALQASKRLRQEYLKRIKNASNDGDFYNESLVQIVKNLELIATTPASDSAWDTIVKGAKLSWYQKLQTDKKLSQKIVQRVEFRGNVVDLYVIDDLLETVSVSDLSELLSKNTINRERYVFIPEDQSTGKIKEYKELTIGHNLVRTSDGIDVVFDEKNKKIDLIQRSASDWVLFLGGDYSNWDIQFRGRPKNASTSNAVQRFNEFGLTGCLTLYQTIINDARFKVSDGQCEDSLNLVRVEGSNVRVSINNAFADALDADFSKLTIASLDVRNSGNDCYDVSGGFYSIGNAVLENCADKALSIGEMSTFEGGVIRIDGANIGISSKDFSRARVKSFDARKVKYCGEAKRKKQEFGGGDLMIQNANCKRAFNSDQESSLRINSL